MTAVCVLQQGSRHVGLGWWRRIHDVIQGVFYVAGDLSKGRYLFLIYTVLCYV